MVTIQQKAKFFSMLALALGDVEGSSIKINVTLHRSPVFRDVISYKQSSFFRVMLEMIDYIAVELTGEETDIDFTLVGGV
jgi:hypothetical protein